MTDTKQVQKLWIEALESGKYDEGADKLYDPVPEEYDALGVLCEVFQDVTKRGVFSDDGTFYVLDGDQEVEAATHILPSAVITWAGLDQWEGNPPVTIRGSSMRVTEACDRGVSFLNIAKALRKTLDIS